MVEHFIGNEEVDSSILSGSTTTTSTSRRGDLSEIMVMTKLIRLGASVWTPAFGHDHPFDLIAHWEGRLSRIQVKTVRELGDNCIAINGSRVVDRKGGKQYPAITSDDCDVIIGYHPETDTAYAVRPTGKTRYQLRRAAPRNNQVIGIMYEADFRLVSLEQIKPLAKASI